MYLPMKPSPWSRYWTYKLPTSFLVPLVNAPLLSKTLIFLSLSISLHFIVLYKQNHVVYILFLKMTVLRFICLVTCISSSLFLLLSSILLYGCKQFGYSFTCWWTFGLFLVWGLLQIKLLWTYMFASLFAYIFPLFLDKYLDI